MVIFENSQQKKKKPLVFDYGMWRNAMDIVMDISGSVVDIRKRSKSNQMILNIKLFTLIYCK